MADGEKCGGWMAPSSGNERLAAASFRLFGSRVGTHAVGWHVCGRTEIRFGACRLVLSSAVSCTGEYAASRARSSYNELAVSKNIQNNPWRTVKSFKKWPERQHRRCSVHVQHRTERRDGYCIPPRHRNFVSTAPSACAQRFAASRSLSPFARRGDYACSSTASNTRAFA